MDRTRKYRKRDTRLKEKKHKLFVVVEEWKIEKKHVKFVG